MKVLMVDDDPAIRKVAEISLTRVGKYDVTLADSGAKALDLLDKCNPDVILLDVMMPGMDGVTTFREIRGLDDEASQIPVIFMTAKVQKQELQSYYELGAAGVIMKPFDPITLPAEIRRILISLACT